MVKQIIKYQNTINKQRKKIPKEALKNPKKNRKKIQKKNSENSEDIKEKKYRRKKFTDCERKILENSEKKI